MNSFTFEKSSPRPSGLPEILYTVLNKNNLIKADTTLKMNKAVGELKKLSDIIGETPKLHVGSGVHVDFLEDHWFEILLGEDSVTVQDPEGYSFVFTSFENPFTPLTPDVETKLSKMFADHETFESSTFEISSPTKNITFNQVIKSLKDGRWVQYITIGNRRAFRLGDPS